MQKKNFKVSAIPKIPESKLEASLKKMGFTSKLEKGTRAPFAVLVHPKLSFRYGVSN